jgi:PAS domain S-box-containing protein
MQEVSVNVSNIQLDFEQAKAKHILFKSKLRSILYGAKLTDEAPVLSHFECTVGKWIYNHALKAYGHIPEMKELEKVHADIHTSARELVALYKDGKEEEARKGLIGMENIADHLVGLLAIVEHKLTIEPPRISIQYAGLEASRAELNDLLLANEALDKKIQQQSGELIKERQVLHNFFMQAPASFCILKGPQHVFELANEGYMQLVGKRNIIGKTVREALPELDGQDFLELLDNVYKTGKSFVGTEMSLNIKDENGKLQQVYVNFIYQAFKNLQGVIEGILLFAYDVTEQVTARKKVEESEEQLRIAIEGGELGTYDFYPQTGVLMWSSKTKGLFGLPPDSEVNYDTFLKGIHPDDKERTYAANQKAMQIEFGGIYENEYRTIGITDGKLKWVRSKGKTTFDKNGKPIRFTGVTQDITKQKEVLSSLQLQSLVLEQMDEGVSVSDENGFILLTNPAEDKMFGYEAGELIGKHVTVQNSYQPEENKKIVNDVIAQIKEKGFWSGEWFNRKKDGSPFYTYSFITKLQTDGTTMFVCMQRDITEEKTAKEALAYRSALLEAQNEAIPDAILIVDTKGKMISFNHHFVDLWKIPEDIVKRKDDAAALQFAMTQLIDPQGFIERVNYCYAHPDEKANEEVLFKDGRIIQRYGNAVIGEDGTGYGWAWYFRDITESRKNEIEIKQSEERFSSLADSIQNLAWIADAEGWIYWYNQRWYNYTGTTLNEMKGWGWDKVHHPDHIEEVLNFVKKAWKKDEPYELTFPLRRYDGEYRWFLTRVVPIKDSNGMVTKWIGTNTDIDDQKKALEQKDEFISIASHELKTPVTSLKGFTQILQMKFQKESNDFAADMLSKMDKQVDKLTKLIVNLLDATKIENGQLQFSKEDFDGNDLINEIVEEMQRSTISHKINVELCDTKIITGDRNRIGQVITNLISNAIKYSPDASDVLITSSVIESNKIKICVQDYGIGIPASKLNNVFDRFFRVTGENRETFPGLGLGLFISKEIIKKHNGEIYAESLDGKGSTFCIVLPVSIH